MNNNFIKAYNVLIKNEGGYSNHSIDIGGETYKGISRRFNKDWEGWFLIDKATQSAEASKILSENNYKEYLKYLDRVLSNNTELEKLVQDFYYNKYWIKFKGDQLPYSIAEELLEQSVLLGTWKTAGRQLQQALNMLNKNNKLFKDLIPDGLVGPKTLDAVSKVKERLLLKVLNGLEFCRFKKSIENHSDNELFLEGWLKRISEDATE